MSLSKNLLLLISKIYSQGLNKLINITKSESFYLKIGFHKHVGKNINGKISAWGMTLI